MKQNFLLPSDAALLAARLSHRQRECLLLVRNGLSSKEIGRLLSLSPSTVDNHVNAAIERMGCSSRLIAAQILETADQFAEDHNDGDKRQINKNDSRPFVKEATDIGERGRSLLPPVGGSTNNETTAQRITHLGMIAIAATMVFAAITITIAGIVELFSQ